MLLLILAIVASLTGFVIHIFTVEWLPDWIGGQMQGIELQASWAVKYVAAITSVEYGIAVIILYYLSREKLLCYGKFKASIYLSVVLLALNAMLIRQPFMDYLIGNPVQVVLIQNGFKWLSWITMSFIVVYGFELIKGILRKDSE